MQARLLYFASLRDAAGGEHEDVTFAQATLAALYEQARARHGFVLPRERLRVARNGAFAHWDDAAADGDEVAFIPPVSGG